MNHFELARFNMIEQQIRPWDVLDNRVLDLMSALPREAFVPEQHRNLAFCDKEIPLAHGQVMMPPRLEARMVQALNVCPDDVALEIGTGSGFVTALLASLCQAVYTVEIHADLLESARVRLEAQGLRNIHYSVGDAAQGWPQKGPYNVIAVTGSVPALPEGLEQSLKIGGRLFVIVGESPAMEALLITRTGENDWVRESMFETDFPALLNCPSCAKFVF